MRPDGSAHVKRVTLSRPGPVEVKQAVNFKRGRSSLYLQNAVKKLKPLAARKILRTARALLRPF